VMLSVRCNIKPKPVVHELIYCLRYSAEQA
jgi:hypothetical protein